MIPIRFATVALLLVPLFGLASPTAFADLFFPEREPPSGKAKKEVSRLYDIGILRGFGELSPSENLLVSPTGLCNVCSLLSENAQGLTKDQLLQAAGTIPVSTKQISSFSVKTEALFGPQVKPSEGFLKWASSKSVKVSTDKTVRVNQLSINSIATFAAEWEDKFLVELSSSAPFTCGDGKQKNVTMMHKRFDLGADYFEDEKFQAIRLPYKKSVSGSAALYVFIPKGKMSVRALCADLASRNFESDSPKFSHRQGYLDLPRFSANSSRLLTDQLKGVGVSAAFDPRLASFKGVLASSGPLYIGAVAQRGALAVNENGTEASVTTEVNMQASLPDESKWFKMTVDHPFVFAIRDDSSAILYCGVINSPDEDELDFAKQEKLWLEHLENAKRNKVPTSDYSYALALEKVGDFYANNKQHKKAVEHYTLQCAEVSDSLDHSKTAGALFKLGSSYATLNDAENAAKSFQKILDLAPADELFGQSEILKKSKQQLEQLRPTLQIDQQNKNLQLINVAAPSSGTKKAEVSDEKTLREALTKRIASAEAPKQIAMLEIDLAKKLINSKNVAEAEKLLWSAVNRLNKNPGDSSTLRIAYACLHDLLLRGERIPEAKDIQERLNKLVDDSTMKAPEVRRDK